MSFFPIFLSIVFVVRNQSHDLKKIVLNIESHVSRLVSDYEIIIVDNASDDASISTLKGLAAENGIPNLQVYALTKEVDIDTAAWVGLENALGDFVAVFDPLVDDIMVLPAMLDKSAEGADVVFASNSQKPVNGMIYKLGSYFFNVLYQAFNGINLTKEAPQYRVINKRVVNFILQHPQPSLTYRHLTATGGFAKSYIGYSSEPKRIPFKKLGESLDKGMRMLVSTTRAPMRFVTSLSLFGALANMLYSIYVVVIGLVKEDVAPGWISLSLQQSGMFFLVMLVLMVLGEYILHMASLSNEGPLYHVAQEFTSARMTRREKLNIEVVEEKKPSNTDQVA